MGALLGTTGSDGMAYVRKKRVGKYEYYQLVEGKRVDGKVRQKVIAHLGKHDSIEDARVAAAQVVPKDSQPADPGGLVETVPPSEEPAPRSIRGSEDAALRKQIKRLRAAARYRARKFEDFTVEAYRRGYEPTHEDWEALNGMLAESGELSRRADELSRWRASGE